MTVIASLKKLGPTLWNHKKKSALGFVCLGALARYLQKLEADRNVFRGYCQQALQYGDENIFPSVVPRRVTVLLKDHKARVLFEKRALPLLNLAGLQVDLVLPQNTNQLTAITSLINRSDADLVYVVGGDETVTHVLTGLLQPPQSSKGGNQEGDVDKKQQVSPPTASGNNNTASVVRNLPPLAIFSNTSQSLETQCENAMAAIKGAVKYVNVLQVKMKNSADAPIFVFNAVHWGKFADTEQAIPRYWYWGLLKHRFGYAWKSLVTSRPALLEAASIRYVEPCTGCSKCYVAPSSINGGKSSTHWLWRAFVGNQQKKQQQQQEQEKPPPDYSKVINEKCGAVRFVEEEQAVRSVEVVVKNEPNLPYPSFNFVYGPSEMGKWAVLREGWKRCANVSSDTGVVDMLEPSAEQYGTRIRAREIEVNLKKKDDQEEDTVVTKMTVGGELMDLADFSITSIPKAIQLITASSPRISSTSSTKLSTAI